MHLDLALRFEYGSAIPWVTRLHNGSGLRAIAGPDQVVLHSDVPLRGDHLTTVADFTVAAGQRVVFTLTHGAVASAPPPPPDAERRWSRRKQSGPLGPGAAPITEWRELVQRSLLTLKALTYSSDRRHRCGADHVAAGTARRPAQLGLSLLLAARRHLHAAGADARGLSRRGAGLGRLAARAALPARRHRCRRCMAWRASGCLMEWEVPWLAGYRRRAAGAHRQCRQHPSCSSTFMAS